MSLVNCVRCNRLFAQDMWNGKLCGDCKLVESDDFTIVREYIRKNPCTTLQEISENTGISIGKVFAWLREGRIYTASRVGGE